MKKIAFSGSFDPITNGHLYVLKEGLEIAGKALLIIAVNPDKKTLFSAQERKEMIYQTLVENKIEHQVDILISKKEFVAQIALENDCQYLIRGIRNGIDFDYESLIQKANTEVLHGAKTIFIMPPRELESVSSSFIKNFIGPVGWHWYIQKFVSESVYRFIVKKYLFQYIQQYTKVPTEHLPSLISTLEQHYQEKNRFYHNLNHILHCYEELDWLASNYEISTEAIQDIGAAIFAHDIIYNAKQKQSDEELSAQWLLNYGKSLNINFESSAKLVSSTAYFSSNQPPSEDEKTQIMHSIDFAILGSQEEQYKIYQENIRQEYSYVDQKDYCIGRIQALHQLLKKTIYQSIYFSKYENQARKNIQYEISQLESQLKQHI
jgi:pantetheine-phosphate adenylyltransferase